MTSGTWLCVHFASALPVHARYKSVVGARLKRRTEVCLGAPEAAERAMAGLTVRDPAVDRSLRSVFGERNSVESSIREGQKEAGDRRGTPPCSSHLLDRLESRQHSPLILWGANLVDP